MSSARCLFVVVNFFIDFLALMQGLIGLLWPHTFYEAEDKLQFLFLLLLPPESWDYRYVLPCPASTMMETRPSWGFIHARQTLYPMSHILGMRWILKIWLFIRTDTSQAHLFQHIFQQFSCSWTRAVEPSTSHTENISISQMTLCLLPSPDLCSH